MSMEDMLIGMENFISALNAESPFMQIIGAISLGHVLSMIFYFD